MPNVLATLAFGSAEHLKALGRMTILFASLDETIATFADAILQDNPTFSNPYTGKPIPELRFDDKQELLKKLVRELAAKYTQDANPVIGALGKAKEASKERNRVIHGWLTWDYKGNRAVFQDKKGDHLPANLSELQRINAAIGNSLGMLIKFFSDLATQCAIAEQAGRQP